MRVCVSAVSACGDITATMTSSETAVVPPAQNQIAGQQTTNSQHAVSAQQATNHQQTTTAERTTTRGFRNRVAVTRSISLLNYTSSGHRIDYRRHRPISQLA